MVLSGFVQVFKYNDSSWEEYGDSTPNYLVDKDNQPVDSTNQLGYTVEISTLADTAHDIVISGGFNHSHVYAVRANGTSLNGDA